MPCWTWPSWSRRICYVAVAVVTDRHIAMGDFREGFRKSYTWNSGTYIVFPVIRLVWLSPCESVTSNIILSLLISLIIGHECPHFFPWRICKVARQVWYMAIRLWWGSVARRSFDWRSHWGVGYATPSKYVVSLQGMVWFSFILTFISNKKIKKSSLSLTTPQNPGGVIRVNLTN